MLFFDLDSGWLALLLVLVVMGAAVLGLAIGRRLRQRGDVHREPLAVLQASMLAVVGLVLAFGLALAVGRYESRQTAVVNEANAIGSAYLRAQTLPEPIRSQSMDLMVTYTDLEITLSQTVPGSDEAVAIAGRGTAQQLSLWTLAGQALTGDPVGSATRLYVESLNDMFDQQAVHIAALGNRVPTPVLLLEIFGAATGIGLLASYLALLGRGTVPVLLGAALVAGLLYVTFDLDRPTRGLIQVTPTALISQRAQMDLPPAVGPP